MAWMLIKEVIAGYALLEAKPYTDLINEVVAAGGEILSQTSQMTAIGNEKSKLKLCGEVEAVKDLGRQYMNLYNSRIELGKKFAPNQIEFGDRFKQMMEVPETKIEKYISGYLAEHKPDFFKE